MKIVNFGSLNLDYVYRVEKFVRPGETISAVSQSVGCGGKGLNQSIALSRAGAKVYHAGCAGTGGERLLLELGKNSVDTSLIRRVDELQGNAVIQVEDSGENCIIISGGSNMALTKEQIKETLSQFEAGDYLLLQNEVNGLELMLDEAKRIGLRVVFNPSPFDRSILDLDLSAVDWLLVNEGEGKAFTGETDPKKIYAALSSIWPSMNVILTLGSDGAWGFRKDEAVFQNAFPVDAVDTTGAGDTFTGYFVAAIARGESLAGAMREAAVASAIAVTRPGAAASIPERTTVLNRINSPDL